MTRRSRRVWKMLLLAVPVLVLLWLGGDFIYSRIVAGRVAAWEQSIERDVRGVQIGAEARTLRGNSTALLLVHGFNDTPQAFRFMGPALNDAGFTVHMARLPGFGVTVDEMHQCTSDQWVQAVLDQAGQLRQSHDHVFVVGHSLGGAVTIAVALVEPDLADGLILLAPAVDAASRRSPLLPTRFWQVMGDSLLVFSKVYLSPFDRNDARDPAVRNPPHKPPFSTRNIVRQTMRLIDDNRDRAGEIRLPVLMVLTRNDRVVNWAAAERFFEQIQFPDKRLVFFDTSGHALTVDYEWPAIVSEINTFVSRVTSHE